MKTGAMNKWRCIQQLSRFTAVISGCIVYRAILLYIGQVILKGLLSFQQTSNFSVQ